MGSFHRENADERQILDLEKSLKHLLEECRMVLPGIQAIFGFQLVAVVEPPFWQIFSGPEQVAHFVALALMTLAMGLVLAPAAYHRLAEPDSVTRGFLMAASHVMNVAMGFLLGGIVVDVYLIARVILKGPFPAALSAGALAAILAILWFFWPLWQCRRCRQHRFRNGWPRSLWPISSAAYAAGCGRHSPCCGYIDTYRSFK